MAKARWVALAVAAVAAASAVWWLKPAEQASTADISALSKQRSAANPNALSAKLISNEDLPPEGTRSLFDHLMAQNDGVPYPFEKLIALVQKQDPSGATPVTLMIPNGRSLLKAQANDEHPRVLMAADFQAANNDSNLGLAPRGQLFLGFVEGANEIEVISYNEAAGRFEFQLVQDYRADGQPKLVYAKRAICTTCHQGGTPIFPQRPWNETNGQPETAAKIAAARNNQAYIGLPLSSPLAAPERFDELTDVGNFVHATQRVWLDGCNSSDCRKLLLKIALRYLSSPSDFDANSEDARKLRELQASGWPKEGIAVNESDLRNRDPIGEKKGVKGFVRGLFTREYKFGEGAKNNEDLDAFDRLPKLPLEQDPLTPRAPKRVLHATDLDGAFGIAAMLTESDFKSLEKAAGYSAAKLMERVDQLPAALFEPAPFSRVKFMQALLTEKPGYCCLDVSEMSPPVASGEPPVELAANSPLKNYEQYCFACHRGNPAKKLNFMAGKTEADVLANVKAKSEIRDALDWERYKGTDKASILMPPSDSAQHAKLVEALKANPKLLEEMQTLVPGMFDF